MYLSALKIAKLGLRTLVDSDLYFGEYMSVILQSLIGMVEVSLGGKSDRKRLVQQRWIKHL
jgi:hypothetical protein